MDKPLRHIEATFKISADDMETFMSHLRQVAFDLDRSTAADDGYYSVSGGYSSSHVIEVKVNKEITHESWSNKLDEYLAEMKAEKKSQAVHVTVTPDAKEELIIMHGLSEEDFEPSQQTSSGYTDTKG